MILSDDRGLTVVHVDRVVLMNGLLDTIWMPSAEQLFWFSPELALVGTIVVILVASVILGRRPGLTAAITLIGAAATVLLTLRVAHVVAGGGHSGLSPEAGAGMLIADNLAVYFKLVLMLFLGGVTALWWIGSARTERNAPEFFVLLIGSALGMTLMVSTLNLLMMVIAIEMASLSSFALVAFDKTNRRAAEAALKYAIFGAVSTALMLYGVSLLYGLFATLNVGVIADRAVAAFVAGDNVLLLGLALLAVLCGIAFKISAVPFHFWCPDAFEGAKIEVTTWLSVVSKAAGLVLLLRLVFVFSTVQGPGPFETPPLTPVAWAIGIMAAVTCTFGNFAAYQQTSVKRLLAYSSIAHAGYMLMAGALLAVAGSQAAIAALLVYILVYLFMNLGAFGVTALVAWQSDGDDSIQAFTGLARRAPWLAVPMIFCLVSLVGLPPFGGFIAKFWLLYALALQGAACHWLGWFLFVVAVFNTLFSLFYYLRVIKQMALQDDTRPALPTAPGGIALVNVCGIVLLVLGVLVISGVKDSADRYAGNLFTPASISSEEALTARDLP